MRATITAAKAPTIVVAGNMPIKSISRSDFLQSEKATVLRQDLVDMTKSVLYNTNIASMFDANELYFVEKHMKYMSNHLTMDHSQYVNNLKLMTRLG